MINTHMAIVHYVMIDEWHILVYSGLHRFGLHYKDISENKYIIFKIRPIVQRIKSMFAEFLYVTGFGSTVYLSQTTIITLTPFFLFFISFFLEGGVSLLSASCVLALAPPIAAVNTANLGTPVGGRAQTGPAMHEVNNEPLRRRRVYTKITAEDVTAGPFRRRRARNHWVSLKRKKGNSSDRRWLMGNVFSDASRGCFLLPRRGQPSASTLEGEQPLLPFLLSFLPKQSELHPHTEASGLFLF